MLASWRSTFHRKAGVLQFAPQFVVAAKQLKIILKAEAKKYHCICAE
jgi:hypothetical protein